MKKLFDLIVFTPEKQFPNEVYVVKQLFEAGLTILHLRKPGFSKEEMADYLKQIPKIYYGKIVIHSHYQLVKQFNLSGVHLTEKSRKSLEELNFLKNNKIKIVSASFHSFSELKLNRRKYKYVFLSPVFNSISKTNYKSDFNLADLKSFLHSNQNSVIALGGITNENIALIKVAGFSGAATIGFIWESKNPLKNYKELVLKIKKAVL